MMTRMAACASRLRRATVVSACIAVASLAAAQESPYSRSFINDTMRVDYLHSGGPGGERLVLDDVVRDGAWPGSRAWLIDDTNLGESMAEVADRATGRLIYSRGFGS